VFVLARIRGWFSGAGLFVAGAGVLFFVGLLVALLVLQGGSRLLWTGQAVTGTEQRGIAYYHWQRQSYTVDVRGYGSARSITIYLDPANPIDAEVDSTADRVATSLGVGLPVLAGIALLIFGGTRSYRWKRRNAKRGTGDFWISRISR
jgi:hypothetical protein